MIDVSIIIVNYNTFQITKNCIDSIYEHTKGICFEVILIDNNSKDNSYSFFSQDNRIIYLYQENNWGFGKANNIGYKRAKGKYLFLLNSDTLLKSNAIKEFFDFMEKSSLNIACIGTMLKDINGKYTTSYNSFPTFWTGFEWFTVLGPISRKLNIIKEHNKEVISETKEVDFVSGADIFMKKEIADKYNLFDPDFFMYFEETEMQYRYRKLNYKNYIYPIPQIIHLDGYSSKQSGNSTFFKKNIILLKSYYLYLEKCKGKRICNIFRFLYRIITLFWIFHPQYSLKEKSNYIKQSYTI